MKKYNSRTEQKLWYFQLCDAQNEMKFIIDEFKTRNFFKSKIDQRVSNLHFVMFGSKKKISKFEKVQSHWF